MSPKKTKNYNKMALVFLPGKCVSKCGSGGFLFSKCPLYCLGRGDTVSVAVPDDAFVSNSASDW